jgi:hypothetical protein
MIYEFKICKKGVPMRKTGDNRQKYQRKKTFYVGFYKNERHKNSQQK